jgi:predicted TIM-barrel fold metal-dependent hydrolase
LDYALCRSYNHWLAEIWKKGQGRLRWVAAPPLRAPDKVREELTYAKDNGACGILMRAVECDLPPGDPYFHPLYELAGELDLPICFHLGTGSFLVHDLYMKDSAFTRFKLPTIGAFHSLILSGTPTKFPKVRWGFIEASSNWLPFIVSELRHRFRKLGRRLPERVLADNNVYVACEVADDLPRVLEIAGDDNLVIGTDYGHTDSSAEIEALRLLRQTSGISPHAIDKILWDNPRRFYGLA